MAESTRPIAYRCTSAKPTGVSALCVFTRRRLGSSLTCVMHTTCNGKIQATGLLTEEVDLSTASVASSMILDVIWLVEVRIGGFLCFDTGGWRVERGSRCLSNGPNYMHSFIGNVMILVSVSCYEVGENQDRITNILISKTESKATPKLTRHKFPSENSFCNPISLASNGISEAVISSIHAVLLGRGSVSCVVVSDPVSEPSSTNDDYVSAVHSMKVTTS